MSRPLHAGFRFPHAVRALAACLVVATWFLWPFTDRSAGAIVYAVLAGSGLLLISQSIARLLPPAVGTEPIARHLALFVAALLLGLACSLGLHLATDPPAAMSTSHELQARAEDALACLLAGLLFLRPHHPGWQRTL
jgi:hypothetical protein